ncbi:Hpt domain-containing protein [Christiangramia salexigens]|uniref:Histidine kinase n=1 Tax=Christiangramia salexigens TaxID=1913577 RepID=A0A1L3J666_9FLAO|nr:Hpt domain-containing protein [Christiangramia salexigens]APG60638.1 histidine kinase [Christiangramia salexigens]
MTEQPNLSYIHQLSGGDKNFEEKLLIVLKHELPEEITQYRKNLKKKEFDAASSNIHKIKHKISILGLEKSYKVAEAYEDELREGNDDRAREFEEILRTMLAFIQQT